MARARRALLLSMICFAAAVALAAQSGDGAPMLGFSGERAAKQRALEAKLDACEGRSLASS